MALRGDAVFLKSVLSNSDGLKEGHGPRPARSASQACTVDDLHSDIEIAGLRRATNVTGLGHERLSLRHCLDLADSLLRRTGGVRTRFPVEARVTVAALHETESGTSISAVGAAVPIISKLGTPTFGGEHARAVQVMAVRRRGPCSSNASACGPAAAVPQVRSSFVMRPSMFCLAAL